MTEIQNKLLIVFSSSNKSNRLSNIYFQTKSKLNLSKL